MINEEPFLLYPSVLSFSKNIMWDLFVPLKPEWEKDGFEEKSLKTE
jgi:hypothetical protein